MVLLTEDQKVKVQKDLDSKMGEINREMVQDLLNPLRQAIIPKPVIKENAFAFKFSVEEAPVTVVSDDIKGSGYNEGSGYEGSGYEGSGGATRAQDGGATTIQDDNSGITTLLPNDTTAQLSEALNQVAGGLYESVAEAAEALQGFSLPVPSIPALPQMENLFSEPSSPERSISPMARPMAVTAGYFGEVLVKPLSEKLNSAALLDVSGLPSRTIDMRPHVRAINLLGIENLGKKGSKAPAAFVLGEPLQRLNQTRLNTSATPRRTSSSPIQSIRTAGILKPLELKSSLVNERPMSPAMEAARSRMQKVEKTSPKILTRGSPPGSPILGRGSPTGSPLPLNSSRILMKSPKLGAVVRGISGSTRPKSLLESSKTTSKSFESPSLPRSGAENASFVPIGSAKDEVIPSLPSSGSKKELKVKRTSQVRVGSQSLSKAVEVVVLDPSSTVSNAKSGFHAPVLGEERFGMRKRSRSPPASMHSRPIADDPRQQQDLRALFKPSKQKEVDESWTGRLKRFVGLEDQQHDEDQQHEEDQHDGFTKKDREEMDEAMYYLKQTGTHPLLHGIPKEDASSKEKKSSSKERENVIKESSASAMGSSSSSAAEPASKKRGLTPPTLLRNMELQLDADGNVIDSSRVNGPEIKTGLASCDNRPPILDLFSIMNGQQKGRAPSTGSAHLLPPQKSLSKPELDLSQFDDAFGPFKPEEPKKEVIDRETLPAYISHQKLKEVMPMPNLLESRPRSSVLESRQGQQNFPSLLEKEQFEQERDRLEKKAVYTSKMIPERVPTATKNGKPSILDEVMAEIRKAPNPKKLHLLDLKPPLPTWKPSRINETHKSLAVNEIWMNPGDGRLPELVEECRVAEDSYFKNRKNKLGPLMIDWMVDAQRLSDRALGRTHLDNLPENDPRRLPEDDPRRQPTNLRRAKNIGPSGDYDNARLSAGVSSSNIGKDGYRMVQDKKLALGIYGGLSMDRNSVIERIRRSASLKEAQKGSYSNENYHLYGMAAAGMQHSIVKEKKVFSPQRAVKLSVVKSKGPKITFLEPRKIDGLDLPNAHSGNRSSIASGNSGRRSSSPKKRVSINEKKNQSKEFEKRQTDNCRQSKSDFPAKYHDESGNEVEWHEGEWEEHDEGTWEEHHGDCEDQEGARSPDQKSEKSEYPTEWDDDFCDREEGESWDEKGEHEEYDEDDPDYLQLDDDGNYRPAKSVQRERAASIERESLWEDRVYDDSDYPEHMIDEWIYEGEYAEDDDGNWYQVPGTDPIELQVKALKEAEARKAAAADGQPRGSAAETGLVDEHASRLSDFQKRLHSGEGMGKREPSLSDLEREHKNRRSDSEGAVVRVGKGKGGKKGFHSESLEPQMKPGDYKNMKFLHNPPLNPIYQINKNQQDWFNFQKNCQNDPDYIYLGAISDPFGQEGGLLIPKNPFHLVQPKESEVLTDESKEIARKGKALYDQWKAEQEEKKKETEAEVSDLFDGLVAEAVEHLNPGENIFVDRKKQELSQTRVQELHRILKEDDENDGSDLLDMKLPLKVRHAFQLELSRLTGKHEVIKGSCLPRDNPKNVGNKNNNPKNAGSNSNVGSQKRFFSTPASNALATALGSHAASIARSSNGLKEVSDGNRLSTPGLTVSTLMSQFSDNGIPTQQASSNALAGLNLGVGLESSTGNNKLQGSKSLRASSVGGSSGMSPGSIPLRTSATCMQTTPLLPMNRGMGSSTRLGSFDNVRYYGETVDEVEFHLDDHSGKGLNGKNSDGNMSRLSPPVKSAESSKNLGGQADAFRTMDSSKALDSSEGVSASRAVGSSKAGGALKTLDLSKAGGASKGVSASKTVDSSKAVGASKRVANQLDVLDKSSLTASVAGMSRPEKENADAGVDSVPGSGMSGAVSLTMSSPMGSLATLAASANPALSGSVSNDVGAAANVNDIVMGAATISNMMGASGGVSNTTGASSTASMDLPSLAKSMGIVNSAEEVDWSGEIDPDEDCGWIAKPIPGFDKKKLEFEPPIAPGIGDFTEAIVCHPDDDGHSHDDFVHGHRDHDNFVPGHGLSRESSPGYGDYGYGYDGSDGGSDAGHLMSNQDNNSSIRSPSCGAVGSEGTVRSPSQSRTGSPDRRLGASSRGRGYNDRLGYDHTGYHVHHQLHEGIQGQSSHATSRGHSPQRHHLVSQNRLLDLSSYGEYVAKQYGEKIEDPLMKASIITSNSQNRMGQQKGWLKRIFGASDNANIAMIYGTKPSSKSTDVDVAVGSTPYTPNPLTESANLGNTVPLDPSRIPPPKSFDSNGYTHISGPFQVPTPMEKVHMEGKMDGVRLLQLPEPVPLVGNAALTVGGQPTTLGSQPPPLGDVIAKAASKLVNSIPPASPSNYLVSGSKLPDLADVIAKAASKLSRGSAAPAPGMKTGLLTTTPKIGSSIRAKSADILNGQIRLINDKPTRGSGVAGGIDRKSAGGFVVAKKLAVRGQILADTGNVLSGNSGMNSMKRTNSWAGSKMIGGSNLTSPNHVRHLNVGSFAASVGSFAASLEKHEKVANAVNRLPDGTVNILGSEKKAIQAKFKADCEGPFGEIKQNQVKASVEYRQQQKKKQSLMKLSKLEAELPKVVLDRLQLAKVVDQTAVVNVDENVPVNSGAITSSAAGSKLNAALSSLSRSSSLTRTPSNVGLAGQGMKMGVRKTAILGQIPKVTPVSEYLRADVHDGLPNLDKRKWSMKETARIMGLENQNHILSEVGIHPSNLKKGVLSSLKTNLTSSMNNGKDTNSRVNDTCLGDFDKECGNLAGPNDLPTIEDDSSGLPVIKMDSNSSSATTAATASTANSSTLALVSSQVKANPHHPFRLGNLHLGVYTPGLAEIQIAGTDPSELPSRNTFNVEDVGRGDYLDKLNVRVPQWFDVETHARPMDVDLATVSKLAISQEKTKKDLGIVRSILSGSKNTVSPKDFNSTREMSLFHRQSGELFSLQPHLFLTEIQVLDLDLSDVPRHFNVKVFIQHVETILLTIIEERKRQTYVEEVSARRQQEAMARAGRAMIMSDGTTGFGLNNSRMNLVATGASAMFRYYSESKASVSKAKSGKASSNASEASARSSQRSMSLQSDLQSDPQMDLTGDVSSSEDRMHSDPTWSTTNLLRRTSTSVAESANNGASGSDGGKNLNRLNDATNANASRLTSQRMKSNRSSPTKRTPLKAGPSRSIHKIHNKLSLGSGGKSESKETNDGNSITGIPAISGVSSMSDIADMADIDLNMKLGDFHFFSEKGNPAEIHGEIDRMLFPDLFGEQREDVEDLSRSILSSKRDPDFTDRMDSSGTENEIPSFDLQRKADIQVSYASAWSPERQVEKLTMGQTLSLSCLDQFLHIRVSISNGSGGNVGLGKSQALPRVMPSNPSPRSCTSKTSLMSPSNKDSATSPTASPLFTGRSTRSNLSNLVVPHSTDHLADNLNDGMLFHYYSDLAVSAKGDLSVSERGAQVGATACQIQRLLVLQHILKALNTVVQRWEMHLMKSFSQPLKGRSTMNDFYEQSNKESVIHHIHGIIAYVSNGDEILSGRLCIAISLIRKITHRIVTKNLSRPEIPGSGDPILDSILVNPKFYVEGTSCANLGPRVIETMRKIASDTPHVFECYVSLFYVHDRMNQVDRPDGKNSLQSPSQLRRRNDSLTTSGTKKLKMWLNLSACSNQQLRKREIERSLEEKARIFKNGLHPDDHSTTGARICLELSCNSMSADRERVLNQPLGIPEPKMRPMRPLSPIGPLLFGGRLHSDILERTKSKEENPSERISPTGVDDLSVNEDEQNGEGDGVGGDRGETGEKKMGRLQATAVGTKKKRKGAKVLEESGVESRKRGRDENGGLENVEVHGGEHTENFGIKQKISGLPTNKSVKKNLKKVANTAKTLNRITVVSAGSKNVDSKNNESDGSSDNTSSSLHAGKVATIQGGGSGLIVGKATSFLRAPLSKQVTGNVGDSSAMNSFTLPIPSAKKSEKRIHIEGIAKNG